MWCVFKYLHMRKRLSLPPATVRVQKKARRDVEREMEEGIRAEQNRGEKEGGRRASATRRR